MICHNRCHLSVEYNPPTVPGFSYFRSLTWCPPEPTLVPNGQLYQFQCCCSVDRMEGKHHLCLSDHPHGFLNCYKCVPSARQKSIGSLHAALTLSGFWRIIKEPAFFTQPRWLMPFKECTWINSSYFSLILSLFHTRFPSVSSSFCVCVFIKADKVLLCACRSVCHCAVAMMLRHFDNFWAQKPKQTNKQTNRKKK